jgi:hypothetical protein
MDWSWRLHPVATQITRPDTHGLFIPEFVKNNVYMPPIPVDLRQLRDKIICAIALEQNVGRITNIALVSAA